MNLITQNNKRITFFIGYANHIRQISHFSTFLCTDYLKKMNGFLKMNKKEKFFY
jgi:hypothetical protein